MVYFNNSDFVVVTGSCYTCTTDFKFLTDIAFFCCVKWGVFDGILKFGKIHFSLERVKNIRFLWLIFFCCSKEAYRMTGSNFQRLPFSSACKALWGNDETWWPDAILLFCWKQQASRRDLQKRSWWLFSHISLSLSILLRWRSWRRNRGRRSFAMSIFEHCKSPIGFFLVCLWKIYSHAKWSWMWFSIWEISDKGSVPPHYLFYFNIKYSNWIPNWDNKYTKKRQ